MKSFASLFFIIHVCLLSEFVKTWPQGFRLAPNTRPVWSPKMWGAWHLGRQHTRIALTRVGGSGLGGKTRVVERELFWQHPFSKEQCLLEAWLTSALFLLCPSQLNQASAGNNYHDNCRAQGVTQSPEWGGWSFWYQGHTKLRTWRHSLKPCLYKFSQR